MARSARLLENPVEGWRTFELDLTMADLMADLDPGWLVAFDPADTAASR